MGEPLSWKPKLLVFKEAHQLAQLESIKRDLLHARQNFTETCKLGLSPIKPYVFREGEPFNSSWLFFVSGAIQYRRCFTQGVRNRVGREFFEHLLSEVERKLHAKLIDVASKHIAHSVNEQELDSVGLQIAIDSKGKLHRGGIGHYGMISSAFSISELKAIVEMIEKIVSSVVEVQIKATEQKVMQVVNCMSDDEICALPDAFPPHIESINFGGARNWPSSPTKF